MSMMTPTTIAAVAALAVAVTSAEPATFSTGSIDARISDIGKPNLLPFLQSLAEYPGSETVGWPHFNPMGIVEPVYNYSELCADPKRPRDVCSAPPLDLNHGRKTSRYLPYLNYNEYRTERQPGKIPTFKLTDDLLEIEVTPQYGGKVYAMTDVKSGRSLLHTPKIHQAIVAARLDAQVDGGIEWNWSPGKLGHWVGTERDVFAAKIQTERGPMIRIYEFDRWNETTFQVDMLVENGRLFAHPRITNPHKTANITGYWWTCVGMMVTSNASECKSSAGTPGTRVISPATYNVNDALEKVPWPSAINAGGNIDNKSHDMSFLSSWSTSGDNFVRIMTPTRPHITVVDKDIFGPTVGLYHGHPLNGTKFWVGGGGKGAKRWYNWKDAPPSPITPPSGPNGGGLDNGGCFFEPQVGHGPTQATGFDFHPESTIQWTEVWSTLSDLKDSEDSLYTADYDVATETIRKWSESENGVPKTLMDEIEEFFVAASEIPVKEEDLIHTGSPFGKLEEMIKSRNGHPEFTPSNLYFTIAAKDEILVQPWLELLNPNGDGKVGTFSSQSLSRNIPQSYQISADWENLLIESATNHGMTWLHAYHLATIAAERLNYELAKQMYQKSIQHKPTAIAYRNLAAISSEAGEQSTRWNAYQMAWNLSLQDNNSPDATDGVTARLQHSLAGEIALYLATTSYVYDQVKANYTASMWDELDKFLSEVDNVTVCKQKGKFCDSDLVAAAHVVAQFHKQTVEGCTELMDVLDTWVMATDSLSAYLADRTHNIWFNYACATWSRIPCQTIDNNVGMWGQCVLLQAEANAGHPLSRDEQIKALATVRPPYWLESAAWTPVK